MGESSENQKPANLGLLFPQESYRIKGACLAVFNELGCGFLEKVYENSLTHELGKRGFEVKQQVPLRVSYDGVPVGDYVIDLLVNGKFIVEVKATEAQNPVFQAQLINYLKASCLPLGFLVNFGMRSLYFKRVIFTKQAELELDH